MAYWKRNEEKLSEQSVSNEIFSQTVEFLEIDFNYIECRQGV